MGDCVTVTIASFLKYHALGNDFLVSLDPAALPGSEELDADFVAAVCDRHRGVGADGVMAARLCARDGRTAGPDVLMELRNADGSRAETSGNGLRCLALALVDAGSVPGPDVLVATDAGLRLVSVLERTSPATALVKAEMGTLKVGLEERAPPLGGDWQARRVDVGNPHLVLIGVSLDGVDIAALGRALEDAQPGGQNIEVVAPDGHGGLEMLVWERGSGVTEACGTGSCAAAAAARTAGLVGERVEVHNPGGTLVVEQDGADLMAPTVWLTGPATRVARIEMVLSEIDVVA
jgi:diaminopimelate epimerase